MDCKLKTDWDDGGPDAHLRCTFNGYEYHISVSEGGRGGLSRNGVVSIMKIRESVDLAFGLAKAWQFVPMTVKRNPDGMLAYISGVNEDTDTAFEIKVHRSLGKIELNIDGE